MRILRSILTVVGLVLFAMGAFFLLQGMGVIRWPADSFMIGDETWVMAGSLIAAGGLVLVLIGRRLPRR